jgi:nucleotide-binding universal stress UspA family protein
MSVMTVRDGSDHRAGRWVVAGVDGSRASLLAVDWAVREAAARHAGLRLVHAAPWPVHAVPSPRHHTARALEAGLGVLEEPGGSNNTIAGDVLAERSGHARALAPGLVVDTRLIDGYAAAELVRESRDAELLVVGRRGLGGFAGLALGSVAGYVSARARCPVLLVPAGATGRDRVTGTVVVGVDGPPAAARPVGFAFEEAVWRDVPLTVVHAWTPPNAAPDRPDRPARPARRDDGSALAAEERLVDRALAGWPDRYPQLPLRRRLVRGSPAAALMAALSAEDLLVVGARGLGGFPEQRLGSVALALLYHAPCPVIVVRDAQRTNR